MYEQSANISFKSQQPMNKPLKIQLKEIVSA